MITYQLNAVCNENLKSFLIVFYVSQNSSRIGVILHGARLTVEFLLHHFTKVDGDSGCC